MTVLYCGQLVGQTVGIHMLRYEDALLISLVTLLYLSLFNEIAMGKYGQLSASAELDRSCT